MCSICQTEYLGTNPSVQIECGHIFHVDCIYKKVKGKWPGPRIVFGFLDCPSCKARMNAPHCPLLHKELQEGKNIEEDVIKRAVERAKHEGIDKDKRLSDPNDNYYNNM